MSAPPSNALVLVEFHYLVTLNESPAKLLNENVFSIIFAEIDSGRNAFCFTVFWSPGSKAKFSTRPSQKFNEPLSPADVLRWPSIISGSLVLLDNFVLIVSISPRLITSIISSEIFESLMAPSNFLSDRFSRREILKPASCLLCPKISNFSLIYWNAETFISAPTTVPKKKGAAKNRKIAGMPIACCQMAVAFSLLSTTLPFVDFDSILSISIGSNALPSISNTIVTDSSLESFGMERVFPFTVNVLFDVPINSNLHACRKVTATSSSAVRPALKILKEIICPSLIGVFKYNFGAMTYSHRLFTVPRTAATHSAPRTLVIIVVSKLISRFY